MAITSQLDRDPAVLLIESVILSAFLMIKSLHLKPLPILVHIYLLSIALSLHYLQISYNRLISGVDLAYP